MIGSWLLGLQPSTMALADLGVGSTPPAFHSALSGSTDVTYGGASTLTDRLGGVIVTEGQALPLPRAVASSSIPGWGVGAVIDRNPLGTWSSQPHFDHLEETEWVAVLLAAESTVDRIEIDPRGEGSWSLGFPKDFILQYAFTSPTPGDITCNPNDPRFYELNNWRPLKSFSNYPQPGGDPISFPIPPTHMGCFRLFGAELSQDDYGQRYLQLDEIALYDD
jgi:hypothetical protein